LPRQAIPAPDGGPPSFPHYSAAVRAGDYVFVSGNAALLPAPPKEKRPPGYTHEYLVGDVKAQTRQTMENVKLALAAAGASLKDVIKVDAFLRDVDLNFDSYNAAYQEFFPAEPPARTTIGAKILGTLLVEIDCIAYAPTDTTQAQGRAL
jgi:2-iminobutanoate/2-iminopropanoate deaminase